MRAALVSLWSPKSPFCRPELTEKRSIYRPASNYRSTPRALDSNPAGWDGASSHRLIFPKLKRSLSARVNRSRVPSGDQRGHEAAPGKSASFASALPSLRATGKSGWLSETHLIRLLLQDPRPAYLQELSGIRPGTRAGGLHGMVKGTGTRSCVGRHRSRTGAQDRS